MCNYLKNNQCAVTATLCPYVYFCDRTGTYKPSRYMPEDCKVRHKAEIPKGYNKVIDYRKGYLYVEVNDQVVKILNPFDEVPDFVRLTKTKNGWRVRK